MSSCFLDTSAVLDLMRHHSAAEAAREPYTEFLLPCVVLGELIAGVHGSHNFPAELARLEDWIEDFEVIPSDEETAYIYGDLLAGLERQGKRIPVNDLWIAAVAVQFDLPLLARDEHFRRLSRLRWVGY